MLASLLRTKTGQRRDEQHSPFSSQYTEQLASSPMHSRNKKIRKFQERQHATADFTETELDDDNSDEDGEGEDGVGEVDEEEDGDEGQDDEDDDRSGDDEDGEEDTPLLPIFSAAHLDSLPVYNLTHAIRLIVLPRTETTLTWDQLRSPQVSQFLVKPMQQQIRVSHFSRATLYALMANCLQFQKESQANPGNAGNSRTRAMVCELLAVKLLKEYNTRELIDALSYDFFPLQGLVPAEQPASRPSWDKNPPRPAAARTSTLEVAIRASAKHFLAHPLVVQQLEAIWAGTIVFHSAADNLHRTQLRRGPLRELPVLHKNARKLLTPGQNAGYGTNSAAQASQDKQLLTHELVSRRTVTLYDPRDASLFKLSRLRVPRYRQFFSTCSLAILLVLFVAVLAQRSTQITTLEVIFWFWSAGFMLDELVGFNEQGFSLYIMSFWNTFDLGILLLLMIYYAMRLYGIFLLDVGRREWNGMAYDVLAANAVLLFPRLFSVLDHYRYFSQLLIAFRLMAVDLMAVFVLILIACSGFFVAFTMSFGQELRDGGAVAYRIFQILMGFTPAAWEVWGTYNVLGQALLVLFLFICHFLVVTILITVLTNSFMAIVSNANEEHQFVFAVNTISMVKNDALFSYVAPSNILAWILAPARFCMPFRAFIKLNRTIIKVTHFPLLFSIYAYEKIFLATSVFEPTDLVENHGRGRKRLVSFQEGGLSLFSPNIRMRQESVAGFQKDKALDEVFRLAPRNNTLRTASRSVDEQTHKVVSNWMDHPNPASPPQEQDRSVLERLEMRRRARKESMMKQRSLRRGVSGTRSVASDPAEFMSTSGFRDHFQHVQGNEEAVGQTDQDGDDELVTNDEDDGDKRTGTLRSHVSESDKENESGDEDYFHTPRTTRQAIPKISSSAASSARRFPGNTLTVPKSSPPKRRQHHRTISTNTILFNPLADHRSSSPSPPRSRPLTSSKHSSAINTGTHTPAGSNSRTPRHAVYATANTKPRPIMPTRGQFQSVPNFNNMNLDHRTVTRQPVRQIRPRRSSFDMGMSDMGLETAGPGLVSSSFATQMALATGGLKGLRGESSHRDDDGMMGRLMLARMKTLEEGFMEVVKEFRGMRTAGNSSVEGDISIGGRNKGKERERERAAKKRREGLMARTKSEIDVGTLGRGNAKGKEVEQMDEPDETPEEELIDRFLKKGGSL